MLVPPPRLVVIGLDSLEPALAFEDLRAQMPVLSSLCDAGIWGRMTSTIPAVTCPAWASMFTGRDPGGLGLYGFRNRRGPDYEELRQVTSADLRAEALWDTASAHGRRVTAIAVPPGYPPRVVNGEWVGCFLSPGTESAFTYPPALREEIARVAPGYAVDVPEFRSDDRPRILQQAYDMAEARFALLEHLLITRDSDLTICCEIGTDRIQHAFWSDHDPAHRHHDPASPYRSAIRDYHAFCDGLLGRVLERIDDRTIVVVASDHGARRLEGGIYINEWLIREGLLVLHAPPAEATPLRRDMIDWTRTAAWAEGGYYGRVFLNVAGREPRGVVAPADYESTRRRLKQQLEAIPDDLGRPLNTFAYFPEELYPEREGLPPDLLVYFDDLGWRALGSVGRGVLLAHENDTGPDHSNHARHGVFVMRDPTGGRGQRDLDILDVAPTLYRALGLPAPPGLRGRAVE